MKKSIRAIVVDDEGLDRELLKNLVNDYCSSISIIGEAASATEAESLLKRTPPDLLFLDINMPSKNGFNLLSNLPERSFLTVFTTGYDSYGIQAIKAGAFDYLLKPIDVDELISLEQKVRKHICSLPRKTENILRIFNNGEHIIIRTDEIVFIAAQGSYSKIYLINGREQLLSKNMKQLLAEVTDHRMLRVHRSYIINIDLIKSYHHAGNEGVVTMTNGQKISISRSYKQALKDLLG